MLVEFHPKIEELLSQSKHGAIVDGAFSTQIIDTSGEIVDIAGADITSLNEDGVLNTEHVNPFPKENGDNKHQASWSTIVGRIIFAKKIFGEQDCESQRELKLWDKILSPFIYGAGELFDADGHKNAQELASMMKHYNDRGLPLVVRYSVEGSTVERKGNILTKTIARRVAMTIKPCNKSSYSGLVAEAVDKEQDQSLSFIKSEKHISISEMEYSPLINRPIDELFSNIVELKKALTLGSSSGAPDTLTGGAALVKEDLGRNIKGRVLGAIKKWDKKTPLEKFLKESLSDIDERILNKFSKELSSLEKKEDLVVDAPSVRLKDLNTQIPTGAKQYKGNYVKPGMIELTAGPFQGNKLKLLHVDNTHVYVEPPKSGSQSEVKVNKLNRASENSHFKILEHPQKLDVPNYVHGDKHSDKELNLFQHQKELIHGIDLASEPLAQTNPHGASETEGKRRGNIGWYMSANGTKGYVKPSVSGLGRDALDKKDPTYIPTAKRSVIFHNLANTFFGLGKHVPTTAIFNHPSDGHEHSVMAIVPNAKHIKSHSPGDSSVRNLVQAGDNGDLDKLAIMDSVMGSSDRNRFNYMLTDKNPNIHLIDNDLIFDHENDVGLPSYLTDYHHVKGKNVDQLELHPEAAKWLVNLDPFQLKQQLDRSKVDPKYSEGSIKKLLAMQTSLLSGNKNLSGVLFAHNRHKEQEVLNG